MASLGAARRWAALGVLTLTVCMLAVDGTVLALAVPALTRELAPTATEVLWIGDIYSFALAGLLVTMGNVADRVGRKRLLLVGAVGFGVASVVAAFATGPEMLIAARAALGVFGATLMPSTLAIVRSVFDDPAERTRAIAVWSAGATAGAAAGPLVGGLLLEHHWWGSVFLINVPIVVLVVVVGAVVLPESVDPGRPAIDPLSALLSLAAIVPVVFAVKRLAEGGVDGATAAALGLGAASGYAFLRRQRRLAVPLLDLALFRIPVFAGAVVANAIAIFAFVGLLFFFSQYLQLVRGLTPLQAGLVELPSAAASVVVVALSAAFLRRLGRGLAIASGLFVAAGGFGLLAVAEGLPGLLWLVVGLAVVGLGAGLTMTLSTDAVVGAAPKARAGAASSIAETAYELGVALGIAVLGSLQTALYRAHLEPVEPQLADAVHESLATATNALGEAHPGALAMAQHAFTSGMQVTSAVTAVLVIIAGVVAATVIPSARSLPEASAQRPAP